MKIVVLTGAGISAESGIKTFRDADGLWEGHDVMKVATPQGWRKNPKLVSQFYNARRAQLREVKPNAAHLALADLDAYHEVVVITQNVDNLHEKAGSKNVLHLHGELAKVRSTGPGAEVFDHEDDCNIGDLCPKGHQLRPHVVWFGEEVPMLGPAAQHVSDADMVLIVGTSMQVYPAAGLVGYAPPHAPIIYIDPRPTINYELDTRRNLTVVEDLATVGVPQVVAELKQREN